MQKNLSIVSQNSKLMLKKSKSLMSITNSILSKDDWMQRLWDWADENGIPDYQTYFFDEGCEYFTGGLPRGEEDLLIMKNFSFMHPASIIYTLRSNYKLDYLSELEQWHYGKKIALPKEASKLVYLSDLEEWYNDKSLKLPKEISNLVYLKELKFIGCNIIEIPKEIGNLTNLTKLNLSQNKLLELPVEIGNLTNLEELWLYENELTELPNEIMNLTNLVKLDFEDNDDLTLNEEQKVWIRELISNGCDVTMNELARRYMYLDEFNIGREVPITPKILDDDIPAEITAKLADGILTFEEYLDEVSEYLDNVFDYASKEKFHELVIKIYDRSEALGKCFERNIIFDSYEDDQLIWKSMAEGEDKKILITHWGFIGMLVKELFGNETKIINMPMKKRMEK